MWQSQLTNWVIHENKETDSAPSSNNIFFFVFFFYFRFVLNHINNSQHIPSQTTNKEINFQRYSKTNHQILSRQPTIERPPLNKNASAAVSHTNFSQDSAQQAMQETEWLGHFETNENDLDDYDYPLSLS